MKKRKLYLQNEPIWLLQSIFYAICTFGMPILGLVFLNKAIISGFESVFFGEVWLNPLTIIILIIGPILLFFDTVAMFSWNIHMNDQEVWMNGDRLSFKKAKIQLPVRVLFKCITSIGIEKSYKNSSGQTIKRVWRFGPRWSQKTYLVFFENKRKRRMNVSHYTEPYLQSILEEVIKRIELCGNKSYDGKTATQILSEHNVS